MLLIIVTPSGWFRVERLYLLFFFFLFFKLKVTIIVSDDYVIGVT